MMNFFYFNIVYFIKMLQKNNIMQNSQLVFSQTILNKYDSNLQPTQYKQFCASILLTYKGNIIHFNLIPLQINGYYSRKINSQITLNHNSILYRSSNQYLNFIFEKFTEIDHYMVAKYLMKCFGIPEEPKLNKFIKVEQQKYYPNERQFKQYWMRSKNKNKPSFKTFIYEDESIKQSTIIVQIKKCEEISNSCDIIFSSLYGEVLIYFRGVNIKQLDRKYIKKIDRLFFKSNVFIIVNSNNEQIMDVEYLKILLDKQNNIIYIQENLKIHDQNNQLNQVHSYTFQNNISLYITQINSNTYIFSDLFIPSFVNSQLQKLVNYHLQLCYQNMKIPDYIPQISFKNNVNSEYLNFIILNLFKIQKKSTIRIEQIAQQIIEFNFYSASICINKKIQDHNININLHYPKMMNQCKLCRVCIVLNKQKMQNIQKQIKKISNPYKLKIKKTKYSCEACCIQYQKQIPLCVTCFKQFHLKIQYYMSFQEIQKKNKNTKNQIKKQEKPHSDKQVLMNIYEKLNSFDNVFVDIYNKINRIEQIMEAKLLEEPPQESNIKIENKRPCNSVKIKQQEK